MKLGNKITMSMLSEGIESKYEEISQMSGTKIEDVRKKMKKVSFKEYIEIMNALKNQDKDKLIELMGLTLEYTAGYNMGGSVSPSQMKAQRGQPAGQGAVQTTAQPTAQTVGQQATQQPNAGIATPDPRVLQQQRVSAMQRLGKKNLGGASAQQAASAVDAAANSKPLTPIQRKSLSQQAASVEALAQDPRTASQFRQLLNRLNKGQ